MTTTSQLEGNHSTWRELQTHNSSLTKSHIKLYQYNLTTRKKSQYLEKTTDIQQVTDKQSHIKLYQYNLTTRRKSQYLEKTTNIHQVTDKLYHIKLYDHNLTTRRKSVSR
jgi:hypothetical protein